MIITLTIANLVLSGNDGYLICAGNFYKDHLNKECKVCLQALLSEIPSYLQEVAR
jgi:hypothetical protein